MPRLPSHTNHREGPTQTSHTNAAPPVQLAEGVPQTDEEEENPIIVAINARRAGVMSRAEMVQQLVTHASTWNRGAVAAQALQHEAEATVRIADGSTPGRVGQAEAKMVVAPPVPRRRDERHRDANCTPAAVADVDARVQQRARERSAAAARAQARAEEARAQARAAVLMDQERIKEQVEQAGAARLAEASRARKIEAERAQTARMAAAHRAGLASASAEIHRSHAAQIAAVEEGARVAASAEAESEIARIRQREQQAEAARREAEQKQAAAQEQAAAALAQAERERARAQQLECEHAKAQAEADRLRKLEEQRLSAVVLLQEQGQRAYDVDSPALMEPTALLIPEPEPEQLQSAELELVAPADFQLTIESDVDSDLQPKPKPWRCSWCTDPDVLPAHRMLGPTGAAELCPACGIEFEALDANEGDEEREVTIDARLFARTPRLQLQRTSSEEQEGSLRCDGSSRRTSPELKAQNAIALRSSSPMRAGEPKWLAWSTHSNNSSNSLAIKPVPRQPPARFVSPRARSSRAKSSPQTSRPGAQEPSTRELKRLLFAKGLDSTGNREELLQRYQDSKRREQKEGALQCEPKKKASKKSVKKQKTRAAQLAELSPRAEQGRARAMSARKESANTRTATSHSPRPHARGGSPRKATKSPRKPRTSKAARASAKLHDRHREKMNQEIQHLGLDSKRPQNRNLSIAELREEKRIRAEEETEAALIAELRKRSVHSADWRKEAAKETKSSMGEAAYGSVRQPPETAEDNHVISPEVRGERMHQHAQRYAKKRAALIGRAEAEASAKARDGWATACGSSRARSQKLAARRSEAPDIPVHRRQQNMKTLKRDVRARGTEETQADKMLAPTQRSARRENSRSHATPENVLTAANETAPGGQQHNCTENPIVSSNETNTVVVLSGLPEQSTAGEQAQRRRLLKRRPSEVLADDIAKLEHNLVNLRGDVGAAPSERPNSPSISGPSQSLAVKSATGKTSQMQVHRLQDQGTRHRKRDKQGHPSSSATVPGQQAPRISSEEKAPKRVGGLFSPRSLVKSPRSPSLEQERAAMQAKMEAELQAIERDSSQQLPPSANQQRLDALMGPDLAKVVDLLPQEQRQLQREELLTLAEKAPANFDSPHASPRPQASDDATLASGGAIHYTHDRSGEDPLVMLEDFVSSTAASTVSECTTGTSA